jgi:acyl dehydratase
VNEPARAAPSEAEAAAALEREVDEAVAICNGDVRAALRAALVASAFLDEELERLAQAVSVGFMRGKFPAARRASDKVDDWREISSATDTTKLP